VSDRKAEARLRILDAASRVLRREGYAAAGVDALAAEAGLTSGAIYSHFRGKEHVLTAVVERSVEEHEANREAGLDGLVGPAWIRAMLRRYLSPEHHAAIEQGCPMPALVSELGRAGEGPQAAFAAALGRLIDRMEARWAGREGEAEPQAGPESEGEPELEADPEFSGGSRFGGRTDRAARGREFAVEPDDPAADSRDQTAQRRRHVMAAVAMAVGGVALARAVGDDKLAGELLAACRETGVESLIGAAERSER